MILKGLKSVFAVKDIRTKIIATLILVLVYKLLSVITVPGVDVNALQAIFVDDNWDAKNQGLSFFSALMWGGLSNFSVILMGLSPYIMQ